MICVVTRPIVDPTCAMSWAYFSERGHTKREGNITDRITTTWDGLCWRSDDYDRHALAKLLFHGSSEVRKDVSVNGRVGVRTVKWKREGYIDEGKTMVRHLRQKCMRRESLSGISFVQGSHGMFYSFVTMRICK